MDPFSGQRWYAVQPQHLAWHAFSAGVLGLLLLILLVSVQSLGEPDASANDVTPDRIAVPVQVEPALRGQEHTRVRLPGVVQPHARVQLGFRIDGHVARLHVREGERVEAGRVIAELAQEDAVRDVRLAEAALSRARAEARDADARLDRRSALLASRSTSLERHDEARLADEVATARVTEAELRLAAARARLAKATLRAPFDGVIERLLVDEHERTSVHEPVVVLTDPTRVEVHAALPDGLSERLVRGAAARVSTPAWPGRSFSGEVTQIDVAVDPVTRTVPFEVELANEDGALRPDGAVEIEVELTPNPGAASLPVAAVLRDADREPFCFVVEEGDDGGQAARRRALRLGDIQQDRVTVLAGLHPGETVVVRGQHFVHAGDFVDPTPWLED